MVLRLNRIGQLLARQKNVLTFGEACAYTGISRTDMYKLTRGSRIPHYKSNGKNIYFNRAFSFSKLDCHLSQAQRSVTPVAQPRYSAGGREFIRSGRPLSVGVHRVGRQSR